jgi:hypothetical protein
VAGDHNDLRSARARGVGDVAADGGEYVEAVAIGKPDVEEHGLVVGVTNQLQGLSGGACGGDDVVFLVKDRFEGFADIGFVVDDENVVHKGKGMGDRV